MGDPPPSPWPRRRRALLWTALAITASYGVATRTGHTAFLDPAPLTAPLDLGDGVVVEPVDLLWPAARLVVARIPRGRGVGLRAALLDPDAQRLLRVGPAAAAAGARVTINGDYHRLEGVCNATPYSTWIDGGRVHVLGPRFSYGASFWVDRAGAPTIGALDVRANAAFPDGSTYPVWINVESGALLWIDRPPEGRWSHPGYVGVALDEGAVRADPALTWQGPALLAKVGGAAEASVRALRAGDVVTCTIEGAEGVALALGTGPRLLEDGALHPDIALEDPGWTHRLGRTALGIDDWWVTLAVTAQTPRGGLRIPDLARALRRLGCRDAINLDGGPSSVLWADGAVRNVPDDGWDPPVASALFVLPPGAGVELR